ncbi:MAG: hypothetical protein PHD34_08270 [Methanothrix soehngenii]|nr:hypothetical protein [Methanothrix soehngenii]MDD5736026.1 hypothetical protein [Methanothrix soehngenii]
MLSVSVNSVPLWFIIVVEKSILAVYGNKTSESRERTEDERTETTIPKQLCGLFKDGWKGMLSVSVNSVPLWFIIAAEKSILAVYVNK